MDKCMGTLQQPSQWLSQAVVWWTAQVVVKRPRTVVALSLLISLGLGVGVLNINVVTESDKLWVPQGTQIMTNRDWVKEYYGPEPLFAGFLLQAEGGGNMLTPEVMEDLYDIQSGVQAMDSYQRACSRDGAGECVVMSVLSLWCNRTHYEEEVVNADDPQGALVNVLNTRSTGPCSGRSFEILDAVAVPSYDASGRLASANILNIVFGTLDDQEEREAFEADYKVYMVEKKQDRYTLEYLYYGAYDQEIERSIGGDIPLVIIAFNLILMGLVFSQADFNQWDNSMMTLANYGMLSVGLSIVMAYGTVMLAGVPFTSLGQIGPFIFIGIGVDDVIVMLAALRTAREMLGPDSSATERMVHTMSHAGISITITSITNFLAFALGSLTAIPAIHWFCLYACTAIVCDFALQLTLFLGLLVINEQKRDRLRGQDANALSKQRPSSSSDPETPATQVQTGGDGAVKVTIGTMVDEKSLTIEESPSSRQLDDSGVNVHNYKHHDGSLIKAALERYVDVILLPPMRALVMITFLGYAIMSILGTPSLATGLPEQDLAPDDSFMGDFLDLYENTFADQTGERFELHFHGFDHAAPHAQARILAAWGVYVDNEYVQPLYEEAPQSNGPIQSTSSSTNWLTTLYQLSEPLTRPCSELQVAADLCQAVGALGDTSDPRLVPAESFNAALETLLATYPAFNTSLSFSSEGTLWTSRLPVTTRPVGSDNALKLELYKTSIQLDKSINVRFFNDPALGLEGRYKGHAMFTYQVQLVYWQQEAVLWDELLLNLSLAGVGVFIVSLVVLVHPVALLTTAAVGLVDLFLFGTLFIGDIRFNVISVINLVMAVGLAVDYTLHFVHTFLSTPGDCRQARVKQAMMHMGHPILLGAGTTLLGILPLAFAASTIFRTFFALLFSTVLYGMAVGLVLLPVLLATIPLPPAPTSTDYPPKRPPT